MRAASSGAHAGERLVEQQHLGLRRQHHGDFELALLAVRQRRRDAWPRPASPAAPSARSAASRDGRYGERIGKPRSARGARDCAASRQFSNAVKAGKMLVFW